MQNLALYQLTITLKNIYLIIIEQPFNKNIMFCIRSINHNNNIDHIMKHFTDNNLFNNNQYGFLKGRSTMLQLTTPSYTG